MSKRRIIAVIAILAVLCVARFALASEPDSLAAAPADTTAATPLMTSAPVDSNTTNSGLIYLVPQMEQSSYRVTNDRNRFKHRISFSPAYGQLGSEDLFAFRVGYSPNTWLGYELSLGHNPASSLHGLLHTFNVLLRYPLSGRFQPYGTLGYGMMTVYPGQAISADPVTKNALTAGGGIEFYIRDDVAVRAEMRGATVLGQELHNEGTVAYDYREYTIGFSFFRSLGN